MVLVSYKDAHKNPAGPGDERPTALQIVKDCEVVGKLNGKVIFITGATSGIGVETARALHATGADIYISARSLQKGEATVRDILSTSAGTGKLECVVMELDSFESIKNGVAEFLSRSKVLNVLITNAGIMACPESTTKDGLETQFGTNHAGHFLTFQLLKQTLLASSSSSFNSRVVSVASSGHRMSTLHVDDYDLKKIGYKPLIAYGQSKLANIYFATELDRRYKDKGLRAWSVHPGLIDTPLGKYLDRARIEQLKQNETYMRVFKSAEQGAATQVWAAISRDLEGDGGKYLSNCQVAEPLPVNAAMGAEGYAPHAYDETAEKRLWEDSLKITGIPDDEHN